MNTIEHTHAAIIALTQYESANYDGDTDTARGHLLDTMRHIASIAQQLPAKQDYTLPRRVENPDRLCMYVRCIDALTMTLVIRQGITFRDYRDHVGSAWVECCRLCESHGWMLPQALTVTAQALPLPPQLQQRR